MKKLNKDIAGFTKANLGIGIGAAVISNAGGNAVPGVGTAMGSMGSMMPMVGTTMIGSNIMRMTKGLNPTRRKRKK